MVAINGCKLWIFSSDDDDDDGDDLGAGILKSSYFTMYRNEDGSSKNMQNLQEH